MPAQDQLNAKTKMVTDYLLLAQSLHQAADSMNAYVAVLASTSTHADTVSLLIPPPQLPPIIPYAGVPLPRLAGGAANSDDEDEGKGKKRGRASKETKEKKIKDPNAPKRPASGYLVYQNSVRGDVKAANPDMPPKEVQAKIASDWATLDAEKKQAFNDEAKSALEDWKVRNAAYEATKEGASGETAAPVAAAKPKKVKSKTETTPPPVLQNVAPSTGSESGSGSEEEASEAETAAAVVPTAGKKSKVAPETSEDEDEEEDVEMEEPPAKKSKKEKTTTPAKPASKKAEKTEKSADKKKSKK